MCKQAAWEQNFQRVKLEGEMYIAIYVTAIVLVCVGAITFFLVKEKKNKKLAEKLKKQAKNEAALNSGGAAGDENSVSKTDREFSDDALPQNQAGLEDFSLQFEKEEKKPKPSFDLNPFKLDNGFTGETDNHNDESDDLDFEDDGFDSENDDDDLDKKFKEYEEFLKRNLDLDDELDDEDFLKDAKFEGNENDEKIAPAPKLSRPNRPENNDLRALQNFDYDSLKGKSEEEIAELIKNLPPRAKEILMSDILARRKFEDEE